MRITIDMSSPDEPLQTPVTVRPEQPKHPDALDAGPAPVGLGSDGLTPEPPAFTAAPPDVPPSAAPETSMSAGPAPSDRDVGP